MKARITRSLYGAAIVAGLIAPAAHAQSDASSCVYAKTQDEAIAACSRALASGDRSFAERSLLLMRRAVVWYERRDFDRAIAELDDAIRVNPHNASAYINRGAAWNAKGNRARAMSDYDTALQLNPFSATAYFNRASLWQAQGESLRALADVNEAIRLDPQLESRIEAERKRAATR